MASLDLNSEIKVNFASSCSRALHKHAHMPYHRY
jgi:hypothetical protein